MTTIKTGAVHHLALTVTDSERSRDFYVKEFGEVRMLGNGSLVLAVKPAPDPTRAPEDDRFDENRVGLDHLCLSVASLAELERAVTILDERNVSHGEIEDLGDTGLRVVTLRDPDNIQIELSAPKN
ncbi:MAG: VOC family protein [Anaerolineae bacterium]|nr:VOC family protein [Anaerolineae bacterium]